MPKKAHDNESDDNDEDGDDEDDDEDDNEDADDESDDEEDNEEVHDDLAAAAMCVNAGSYHEPQHIGGLAHFCEHMLFMGSKKYPGY